MNKAILVIDMPKNCYDCPLSVRDEYDLGFECCLQYKGYVDRNGKPNWCPLKPAPEKYEIDKEKCSDPFYEFEFEYGYNQCVDEILEKQENEND